MVSRGDVGVLHSRRQSCLLGALVHFDQQRTSLWSGKGDRCLRSWGHYYLWVGKENGFLTGMWLRSFYPKSGPWPLCLYLLNAFLLNSIPFKKDKELSYVSSCCFKFKRTLGPSAEVDPDIWYSHWEAAPGSHRIPGLAPFSTDSTSSYGLSEHPYKGRRACSVFGLMKCLLLFLQMGNKRVSTLKVFNVYKLLRLKSLIWQYCDRCMDHFWLTLLQSHRHSHSFW